MTNPEITGRRVPCINYHIQRKPIGIAIGVDSDPDSDTDPDNTFRAASNSSYNKASGSAAGYYYYKPCINCTTMLKSFCPGIAP